MTETEWMNGDDQVDVVDFLSGRVRDRKLRLFAIACCRNAWKLLDENERDAANFLEKFVEGEADETDRAVVYERLRQQAASVAQDLLDRDARFSAEASTLLLFGDYHDHEKEKWQLLHDIFGNPFRPITIDQAWMTPNAAALAQAIYDDRAFDRMPELADALEEAGCDNADILAHCRGPGPHVRGCWVIDLLLGRE